VLACPACRTTSARSARQGSHPSTCARTSARLADPSLPSAIDWMTSGVGQGTVGFPSGILAHVSLSGLADVFLEARTAEGHGWRGEPDALEPLLSAHLEAARSAWPAIAVAPERFVAHLARRLPPDAAGEELAAVRASDLYLACACADGDAAAIGALEGRYFGEVDAAAARMRCPQGMADEVKQMLRRILFVAEGDRPAAVGEFAGRGDLRGWLRVSAVRELQRLLGKARRHVPLDDERFLDLLSPAQDPELGHIREHYRAELTEAVAAAMAATPARERALLRFQVLDGLSIDQIGALYGVHRATAARWLVAAREGILERTRAEVARRLGIASGEVDSIIRLVQSRLEVSVERLLR
jgi:RNA polymerase sigma-70 factor, ECF subfamily